MDYITTNVRLPREDYFRLKAEAAKKRISFSAMVRERVALLKHQNTKDRAQEIMNETKKLAKRNAKTLKGWDSLKALRQIRDEN